MRRNGLAFAFAGWAFVTIAAADDSPLRLVQTVPLPRVEGRIDHLAIDVAGQRLFVAALGNSTLEIVDLKSGKVVTSLHGFSEPQGVAFVPEANWIVVANGGDGSVSFVDGNALKKVRSLSLGSDADNVRYDARRKVVYVGYGDGALVIIDATKGEQVGEVRLSAHPESFQIDETGRLFANVEAKGAVAVVDPVKKDVVATWPLKDAAANFPMALDVERRRVFVGTRRPPRVLVLDADAGNVVATLDAEADSDDLFYDAATRRVYGVFGAGSVLAWTQDGADKYHASGRVSTAPGARTGLFSPELHRMFVAVPHRGSQPAEIRVYEPVS
jgi:DNA-binding beta-propeller fold protein YncE